MRSAPIVTPNDTHLEIAAMCLEKKVPVLCEKPLTHSAELATKLADLAAEAQVVNMVNFVHRGSPELQKAAEIVKSGELGNVMHIEASYLQSWMTSEYWGDWKENETFLWRLSSNHAGAGVVSDFGPALLDLVSLVAGEISKLHTNTRSFNKGVRGNRIQRYNLDSADSAVISADFVDGAMGALHMTRWATGEMDSLRLRVYGDEGGLTLDIDPNDSFLEICSGEDRHRAKWKKVKIDKGQSSWQNFVHAVENNDLNIEPSFAHAAKLQKLLEESMAE